MHQGRSRRSSDPQRCVPLLRSPQPKRRILIFSSPSLRFFVLVSHPAGTITGAHMIRTPHFIQITGTLKGTNINIKNGDEGGELDPHGG